MSLIARGSNLLHKIPQHRLAPCILQPRLHAEMQRLWPLSKLNPGMVRHFPVELWLELLRHKHGVVVVHKSGLVIAEHIAQMEILRLDLNS